VVAYLTGVPYCEVTIKPIRELGGLGGLVGDKGKPATEQWTITSPNTKHTC